MATKPQNIADSPSTLSSVACERLRRDIIHAVLLPGQKLHIGNLCEQYDIGLSPMREALNRLARDGLVTHSEQRGFHVTSLSEAHLEELTKTRGWLDSLALRESIAHGDSAWEEQVVLACHRLSKMPRKGDTDGAAAVNRAWEDAHRDFHATLVAGCGSSWLIGYCAQLFDAADRYRHLSRLAQRRDELRVRDEHRDLMEAVVARDADTAVRLLQQHQNRTAELVRSALRKLGDR